LASQTTSAASGLTSQANSLISTTTSTIPKP
jgi:hypothetical protein